jgi:hypothetical protein
MGDTVMSRLKLTLCLLSLLAPLGAISPLAVAAPDQFKLGAEVAATNSLPATNKAKPAKVKAVKGAKRPSKVAAKTKARKTADVIATDIPPAKLDLTLPKDMVNQLQPPGQQALPKPVAAGQPAEAKPLLPSLFAPKDGAEPFQLDGRLLTNEMELQLRNQNRREVEGAALDFKFRQ